MFMFQSDWGWGGRKMGEGGGEKEQKMVGRLGGEVCVAVRRMCSVSGVLATPVVPTNVSSTICSLHVVRKFINSQILASDFCFMQFQ